MNIYNEIEQALIGNFKIAKMMSIIEEKRYPKNEDLFPNCVETIKNKYLHGGINENYLAVWAKLYLEYILFNKELWSNEYICSKFCESLNNLYQSAQKGEEELVLEHLQDIDCISRNFYSELLGYTDEPYPQRNTNDIKLLFRTESPKQENDKWYFYYYDILSININKKEYTIERHKNFSTSDYIDDEDYDDYDDEFYNNYKNYVGQEIFEKIIQRLKEEKYFLENEIFHDNKVVVYLKREKYISPDKRIDEIEFDKDKVSISEILKKVNKISKISTNFSVDYNKVIKELIKLEYLQRVEDNSFYRVTQKGITAGIEEVYNAEKKMVKFLFDAKGVLLVKEIIKNIVI